MTVINIQSEVNPHFREVWTTNKPFVVLKGGRSSFKSSVIALDLAYKMIKYIKRGEKANVVVIRKVANTIRDSVFLKIQWALNKFGLMNEFKTTVSPFTITHKKTGSTFYFYGQDDFAKLKSNDIGRLIAVWYEESAEFKSSEEFDQSFATFARQNIEGDIVKFYWSYNPPRNPFHWINEWAEGLKDSDDYLVHESSYLDDELGFVNEQMLAEINRIKDNDYDYYRYIYLGEAVGLGTNVYNFDLFKRTDKVPDDERILYLYFGLDAGHQQSATVSICAGYTNKGNLYILDMYYYSPAGKANKKSPSQLSKEVQDFEKRMLQIYPYPVRTRTIDSAEGALRNEIYTEFGIRWHPVAKKKKTTMTDYVNSLLAQGRLFYLPFKDVDTFEREHKNYRWDEKTLQRDNPDVVKEDDHSCDALQYLIIDNSRDLNLVW